ncbi:MAG TPA: PEGA domain-containing protein, partial [Polyangia bacterium]|nr:PEGA domain-containing protein [Polyangia bacterium]
EAGPVEQALIEAARETPWIQLANVSGGKLTAPRAVSLEARVDPHAAARALALGRETGAQRVLTVEIARLGEGRVAFLQAIDAAGKSPASTTVSLPGADRPSAAERVQLRAALVKVVDAARYVGRLDVRVDVPGAEVQLDGRRRATYGTVELPVGTHALRVTHPAYHDFLRFIDVEFDRAVTLDVALSAYPLAEGEMSERQRQLARKPKPVPWYRSWWALSICGAVVAATTAGIIYGTRPSISADRSVTFQPPPGP